MDHHTFFEGENHSNNYTKFRPKTPQTCIDWILKYLSETIKADNSTFSSAADIGCGTGNSARSLTPLTVAISLNLCFCIRSVYFTFGKLF